MNGRQTRKVDDALWFHLKKPVLAKETAAP
jgi:hypothetical protein